VDQVLGKDATGTMAGMQFRSCSASTTSQPLAVMYVDYRMPQIDDKNMQDHSHLRSLSGQGWCRPANQYLRPPGT